MKCSHIAAVFGSGLIQLRLPAAGNQSVGSLFDKALGSSQPIQLLPPVITAIIPRSTGMIQNSSESVVTLIKVGVLLAKHSCQRVLQFHGRNVLTPSTAREATL